MEPQPALNLVPTIQQAITNLLTTHEPEFLRFGYGLFMAFATIVLAWQGIRLMFSSDSLNDKMFEFAKMLLFVSFGYALITFYESPLPGIGVSFSNLITDQTAYFQSVLEARSFDNIYQHFDELSAHFMQPDAWSILANLIYWTVLLLIAFAKALSLAVIAFGLIASAVCGLLGPIFVPFLHRPEAGLAVLGLAESLHSVFVHPGCGHRVPDDFRAVRIPLRDDPTANDYIGGVRRVRTPSRRRDRDVLHGHRACPVAHQLDLLWPGRPSRRPWHSASPFARVSEEGSTMPRRFTERFREPELMRWSDVPGLAMAFGIVLLLGLVIGRHLDRVEAAWKFTSFMSFRRSKP